MGYKKREQSKMMKRVVKSFLLIMIIFSLIGAACGNEEDADHSLDRNLVESDMDNWEAQEKETQYLEVETVYTTEEESTVEEVATEEPTTKVPTTEEPTTEAPTEAPTEAQNQPNEMDYILNKNSKVFHYPGCKSVKKMKESNKIYFTGTRDEVISKGYKSCGNCNP